MSATYSQQIQGKKFLGQFLQTLHKVEIVSNCLLKGFISNKNVIQLGTNVAKGIKAFMSRQ